ncbi:unnamed protein product [Onchocerca flexuosa]|uniref:Ovule protein n=1 Tax=Onchocerca flexuosa TaxID=387005 RepID=A0A183HSL6_9BILA|nr:unnamed protein product [Onchocerca flexuosa]
MKYTKNGEFKKVRGRDEGCNSGGRSHEGRRNGKRSCLVGGIVEKWKSETTTTNDDNGAVE